MSPSLARPGRRRSGACLQRSYQRSRCSGERPSRRCPLSGAMPTSQIGESGLVPVSILNDRTEGTLPVIGANLALARRSLTNLIRLIIFEQS